MVIPVLDRIELGYHEAGDAGNDNCDNIAGLIKTKIHFL